LKRMAYCPDCGKVFKFMERDNETGDYYYECPNRHEWTEGA